METINITAYTLTSALGCGVAEHYRALINNRSGLAPLDFPHAELETSVGQVPGLDEITIPAALADYRCRNNLLAQFALQQDDFMAAVDLCRQRYGAHRVALVLGTSTSGILETELAYRGIDANGVLPVGYSFHTTHELNSLSEFVKRYLRLDGLAFTISTACSSSAKVFSEAWRLIQAGLCDAAVVGGVDSLCLTTLYGFNSLELVSPQPCRPADKDRDGISLGEAGGFAILEKASNSEASVSLAGFGESSDAHHMSTPSPDGKGARLAMQRALEMAMLTPQDIGYINLHGTATPSNDLSESHAVFRLFGAETACSSTKGWTGHTLGAAGICEAVLSMICIEKGLIPQSLNTVEIDPELKIDIRMSTQQLPVKSVLSNSFGFGGSNCSLIFRGGF